MSNIIGVITDIHRTTDANAAWSLFGQNEYRRFSTAQARTEAAAAEFESDSVDFMFIGGDAIDANSDDPKTHIGDVHGWASGEFSGDIHYAIGNHEYSAEATDPLTDFTWAAYITGIGSPSYSSGWSDGGIDKAYSFDSNGIHYVVLCSGVINATNALGNGHGQYNWLESDIAATSLPIVILTHMHLSNQLSTLDLGSPSYDYINITEASDVRSLLEANGNVQAVIQCHYHAAYNPPVYTLNDIQYVSLGGSVLAPNAADNTYYKIQIIPNAVWGTLRARAAIEITGYGRGLSIALPQYTMKG